MLQTHEYGRIETIINVGHNVTLVESFYPFVGNAVETSLIAEDSVCGSEIMGAVKVLPNTYLRRAVMYPKA